MIDAFPNKYARFNEAFNDLVDSRNQEHRLKEKPRNYLGGSRLGVKCMRALGYEWHGTPKDPDREFSGRLFRIFDRGHHGEEIMIDHLRVAGFVLSTEKQDGGQHGFAVAYDEESGIYRIRGHADGIIKDGPDEIGSLKIKNKYPMLWENKVLQSKYHQHLAEHGLRASKWEYYVQCQIYMAYLGLEHALFTAVDANLMTLHAEIVPFDSEVAQEASDRGVRVISSSSPEELPRCTDDETNFQCRLCSYPDRCWADRKPAELDQDWAVGNWKP